MVCLLLWQTASAQPLSNRRVKWVHRSQQARSVDSLSVYPGSIRVISAGDTALPFSYEPGRNGLQWKAGGRDSVLISYQVLPFRLGKPAFHRDRQAYDSSQFFVQQSPSTTQSSGRIAEPREEFFHTSGIKKTGSLTRGISFGNTQNVFVNSALNLQMEGKLTDDISLTAVISDQNVPFQPEGNTQHIQDFDKVFVQLRTKRSSLLVGDVVMQQPQWRNNRRESSHFLRYYKNVQGGQATTEYNVGKSVARTSAGIAVSKGKFASIIVEVSEGVQGPYRLRGPANEKFIIVLANSEKVYVDGQLLQRGFNYDYVIDYNQAEITFNTGVVITKFSRVRVDFEYSDRNYSRTITNAFHQQQTGKIILFANVYNEKDNPRNPLTVSLTDADKQLLSEIGDSLDLAVVPAINELEAYDANQVLYERVDSVVDNVAYAIYKQSTHPQTARYQLQFSEVGQGRGNYVPKTSTANGKVYEWRLPVNGIPQGDYEPVQQLPTPTQKQVITLGSAYQMNQAESVYGEMAFSKYDLNLFSAQQSADDNGNALKVGYVNQGKPLGWLPGYQWIGGVDYERDDKYFNPIDRFRYIEFDRDWSTLPDSVRADDHIFNATLGIRKASTETQPDTASVFTGESFATTSAAATDQLVYRLSRRLRGESVNGWQHKLDAAKKIGRLQVSSNAFWLQNTRAADVSEWQRLQVNAAYVSKYLVPGYLFSVDKNRINSLARPDSVTGSAMHYQSHQVYVKSNDTLQTKFNANYSVRRDDAPVEGKLVENSVTHMANMGLQTKIREQNDVRLQFTYRNLENLRVPAANRTEETIMGRLDWNGDWLDEHVRSELTFTAGTGRELKREYIFLPVPAGQGTHTWRDDNGDGVQELNEFYLAINPDERNYAKFFVPTDQYIRAYTNSLNYRLNLTAPRNWQGQNFIKSFLASFSSVTSWTINRKMTDGNLFNRFVPFSPNVPDEALLSTQDALRTTLFYNRTNPQYGIDLNMLQSTQKQLLTNGFESSGTDELKLNGRVNLMSVINLKGVAGNSIRRSGSDYLSDRNYRVRARQAGPEIAYQPKASFRLTAAYLYTQKENAFAETAGERAVFHQMNLDARLTKVSRRTLAAQLKYTRIDFNGQVNTPLGYEMLEALQPGGNWNWSFNLQQRLLNGLQINVNYEGRKSDMQPIVHIGSMQVTALF